MDIDNYYKNSIIFVTAFKDIGREKWNVYSRSNEIYFANFMKLAENIDYNLVCFLDDNYYDLFDKRMFKQNIHLFKYSEVNSFYNKYIDSEKNIINSIEYKNKIPDDRKDNPEHWSAEYNLVNHSKVNFVAHTKKIYPDYEYYSWIDFGCISTNLRDIPKFIDINKLNSCYKKITYITIDKFPEQPILEEEMLKTHTIYIGGSQFIVHTDLVYEYEKKYDELLQKWKDIKNSDDDQNAVFQIYFKNKDIFNLYEKSPWFSLFSKHLNSNIVMKNKNDIHKLINCKGLNNRYAEIGVARGEFTKYILNNTELKELFLIDPYKNFDINEFTDAMNFYDMENEYKICKHNLELYNNRIKFIRKTSNDALIDIDDNSLDVLYIDGNQRYQYVLFELKSYWKKMRKGGIIFGDDIYDYDPINKDVLYTWDNLPIDKSSCFGYYGVHAALVDFCKEMNIKYYIFSNQFMIFKY